MMVDDGFEVVDGVLVNYTGSQERIELPPAIHTIGTRAFASCSSVREVTLGPEVETVRSEAFAGCRSLEAVFMDFHGDFFDIESNAFAGCASLRTLTMEGSYLHMGHGAFEGRTALRELDFCDVGMIEPGEQAFAGCTGLTKIATRGSSISIGDRAFLGCTALRCFECNDDPNEDGEYLCREDVGNEAFAGCTALERVRIDRLHQLGQRAFKDCTSLTQVELPAMILELGNAAFAGCTTLASVKLPKARAFEDASDLFRDCTSLTYVDLDDVDFSQVRSADGMFAGCTSLEEVDLSGIDAASLASTEGMFAGCTSLVSWKIPAAWPVELPGALPEPPADSEGAWWSERERTWLTVEQIVARGHRADSFNRYNPQEQMELAGAEIEDGVLLSYDGSRSTVVVSEAIRVIHDWAFRNCTTLESIILPDTLERIGMEAFAGCSRLRKVEFASGGKDVDCPLKIERRAFADCTSLKAIELLLTMHKELGDYLFEGCTSLVSATLPAVGGFGDFKGCTRLHEVTVGGVTFYASDSDEDYLSYVVMAARSDIVDIRDGVIYGFTKRAMSAIYDWMVEQERHHERVYGCAVLPEGYHCTAYLGRCSRIGIIPKDVRVRAIAPKAFSGISNLVAFVAPEGRIKVGWRAFPDKKRKLFELGRPRDVSPDWW